MSLVQCLAPQGQSTSQNLQIKGLYNTPFLNWGLGMEHFTYKADTSPLSYGQPQTSAYEAAFHVVRPLVPPAHDCLF